MVPCGVCVSLINAHYNTVKLPVEACEGMREEVMKAKEQAILTLGRTLAKNNASEGNKVAYTAEQTNDNNVFMPQS